MILSIQSNVVYGCVGNQAAAHVAHLLDHEISCIPTGLFSTHKGHKSFTNLDIDIKVLVNGLRENKIFPQAFNKVLVGYLGTLKIAEIVYDLLLEVKTSNPKTIIFIDPVMGDNNHLYVERELIEYYKSNICALADVITPNEFEASLLKDMKTVPRVQIVTSKTLSSEKLELNGTVGNQYFSVYFDKIQGWYCGTGDIFAAILGCKLENFTMEHIKECCQYAVNCMQLIIRDNPNRKDLKILKRHFE
eukprot:NODE_804_length_4102_cov_0.255309.p4 type:complete len:247 gc:universal NODE_804_length_4102_cov_0.255309:1851-2591(+)